jgi:hypothetical protein
MKINFKFFNFSSIKIKKRENMVIKIIIEENYILIIILKILLELKKVFVYLLKKSIKFKKQIKKK